MSDAKETPETEDAPKKKKGKLGKIIVMAAGVVVLLGGGVGAGLYAANSGLIGSHAEPSEKDKAAKEEAEADASHPGPKLVPKAEQKRAGAGSEGDEGGHGGGEGGEGGGHENAGMKTPIGDGGERYASN